MHEARRGEGPVTDFGEVIAATPPDLVAAGLYNELAFSLTDGPHLRVSMKLLARGVVGRSGQPSQLMSMRRYGQTTCKRLARAWHARLLRARRRNSATQPGEILLGYTEPHTAPPTSARVAPASHQVGV